MHVACCFRAKPLTPLGPEKLCVAEELEALRTCTQAFLTPDYLAIAMEHTHSGSLQDYITSNSQGHLGMGGLDEGVARYVQLGVPSLHAACTKVLAGRAVISPWVGARGSS